ncbi:hypothetical protein DIPPA_06467 [Diplonema papillatum]|nr:hypothetical protein DIPPA_06467 [Diplonema papillatum]
MSDQFNGLVVVDKVPDPRRPSYCLSFTVARPVKLVTEHAFLGVVLDTDLTYRPQAEAALKSFRMRLNALVKLSFSPIGRCYSTIRTAYLTFVAAKWRYGLGECRLCGHGATDVIGSHAQTCFGSGRRTRLHNALRDIVADFARRGLLGPSIERAVFANTRRKRPDISYPHYATRAAAEPGGAAAAYAVAVKERVYNRIIANEPDPREWRAVPLVVDTFGAWCPGAITELRHIARANALREDRTASAACQDLFHRLSFSIAQGVARIIAEGIVDDGGGGALFNVVSDRGISLAAFSQYPEEEEVLLPLCSVLKVISVTPGQDGQVSVINADLVCALTHRREIMRFQSLAVAEARLEGEWLTKLALLRKSDETVSPQSSEDSGVSSDDDGEFLSESEINGIAELVRSATLGSIRPADDDYDDSPLLENRQNRGHQDQARSNQTPSQATTELEKAAIQSQGPAFDTNTLADDQTTRDLCLRMRSEYLLKKGDVVDELVSNLRTVHPRGTIEHKREVTQRLSILCKLLWDKTRDVEEVKGLTSVELLVGWLYTSHGVDVDRLMGFNVPGFPDPSDPCHAEKMQAWASYTSEHRTDNPDPEKRTRNGTLFKDVNWALRREGTRHKSDPRAGALIKKWCKYIGSLQAILSRPLLRQPDSGLLYRGFGGQSEGVFLHYKNTAPRDALFWTAFSSCTANRPIALRYITGGQANARAKVGHAFLFFVSKIKAGLAMGPVSQYPQEDEITMPLSALTVVDTGEDVALSKELTSTIQVNLLSEVRLKPENDGKTEEELQSIVQRRLEESPLRTAVVQVEVKSAFAVEIVNDLLYFARADARRASRRMLRLYGFVQRAEHPTPLGLAREELLDATEDFEAKDFEGLFALPPRPANVAFNAVEGLRWVFEPQGRETVMVTDALDRIAGNKGPHGLRDRLCQWTADCTKRDDLPDETATKRRLHAFARSRKTRPDILRRDFPELEALSRWLRAVHNYAVELIEVVRQNTQATALKVEKKRQKQKVEAA